MKQGSATGYRGMKQKTGGQPSGTSPDSGACTLYLGLQELNNSVVAGGMRTGERSDQDAVREGKTMVGRDEMNLVECPLSVVAERFLDGRKTVVYRDQVWVPDR